MPLQLSPEDAATLASLPSLIRIAVTRDLEAQQHARHLAAVNDAAWEHAAASFAAHPIARQIAALNERHARAAPPGAGPRPQPAPYWQGVGSARALAFGEVAVGQSYVAGPQWPYKTDPTIFTAGTTYTVTAVYHQPDLPLPPLDKYKAPPPGSAPPSWSTWSSGGPGPPPSGGPPTSRSWMPERSSRSARTRRRSTTPNASGNNSWRGPSRSVTSRFSPDLEDKHRGIGL